MQPLAIIERACAFNPHYGDVLRQLATRLRGDRLSLTAAHNDLTMANVLIADDGIGIVDWEEAAPACLPLGDTWYALVDALARAMRTTHAAALGELLAGTAPLPPQLARAPESVARALALGDDHAIAGFHACWLRHASNEVRRGELDGRFLEIVRALADGAITWEAGAEASAAISDADPSGRRGSRTSRRTGRPLSARTARAPPMCAPGVRVGGARPHRPAARRWRPRARRSPSAIKSSWLCRAASP